MARSSCSDSPSERSMGSASASATDSSCSGPDVRRAFRLVLRLGFQVEPIVRGILGFLFDYFQHGRHVHQRVGQRVPLVAQRATDLRAIFDTHGKRDLFLAAPRTRRNRHRTSGKCGSDRVSTALTACPSNAARQVLRGKNRGFDDRWRGHRPRNALNVVSRQNLRPVDPRVYQPSSGRKLTTILVDRDGRRGGHVVAVRQPVNRNFQPRDPAPPGCHRSAWRVRCRPRARSDDRSETRADSRNWWFARAPPGGNPSCSGSCSTRCRRAVCLDLDSVGAVVRDLVDDLGGPAGDDPSYARATRHWHDMRQVDVAVHRCAGDQQATRPLSAVRGLCR